jgi:hypothetical protein
MPPPRPADIAPDAAPSSRRHCTGCRPRRADTAADADRLSHRHFKSDGAESAPARGSLRLCLTGSITGAPARVMLPASSWVPGPSRHTLAGGDAPPASPRRTARNSRRIRRPGSSGPPRITRTARHPAPGCPVLAAGMERLVRSGGPAPPGCRGYAAAELGAALGRSIYAGQQLVADALDVRHRLPVLWAGTVPVWRPAGSPRGHGS